MERQRSARLSGPVADREWRPALSRNFKKGSNGRRVMPVKHPDGSSSDDKEGAQGFDPDNVMFQREYNRCAPDAHNNPPCCLGRRGTFIW